MKLNKKFPLTDNLCIYFYMHPKYNSLFLDSFMELSTSLAKLSGFQYYFYIRYKDPQDHLRIRIFFSELDDEEYIVLRKMIRDFFTNVQENVPLYDYRIMSYEPEINRYEMSPPVGLSKIEEWFFIDSVSCYELNKIVNNNLIDFSIETVFVISSLHILNKIFENKEEGFIEDILSGYNQYNKHNQYYKLIEKDVKGLIGEDNNWDKMYNTNDGMRLSTIIEQRNKYLYNYFQKIDLKNESNREDLKRIVPSILHMHFNRLIGIDREKENKLMSILYKYIHNQRNKKKYLQGVKA